MAERIYKIKLVYSNLPLIIFIMPQIEYIFDRDRFDFLRTAFWTEKAEKYRQECKAKRVEAINNWTHRLISQATLPQIEAVSPVQIITPPVEVNIVPDEIATPITDTNEDPYTEEEAKKILTKRLLKQGIKTNSLISLPKLVEKCKRLWVDTVL
jgi:hypothetical protein